jgi:hypothetical protein
MEVAILKWQAEKFHAKRKGVKMLIKESYTKVVEIRWGSEEAQLIQNQDKFNSRTEYPNGCNKFIAFKNTCITPWRRLT